MTITIVDQSFKYMTVIRSHPFLYVEHLENFRRKAAEAMLYFFKPAGSTDNEPTASSAMVT
jgi:hypothetical protein